MKKISSILTILLISFTMTATMIQDISFGEERVISAQGTLNKGNIKSELKIESKTISAGEKLNFSKKENDNIKNKHEYISSDQIMIAVGSLVCLLLITVVIINNSQKF